MLSESETRNLVKEAKNIRATTLRMMNAIGVGHLGGAMSVVDILTLLYCKRMNIRPNEPRWPDRDRLILSKGHAGPALYATLARRGYFPEEECLTLNQNGTKLPSHCDMTRTIGIDMTAGSLGQGLSAAVGMALAGRLDGKDYRVHCIMGDGEMQEGQIWEAMMYAGNQKLRNLTIYIDRNRMQIDGTLAEVNDIEPLADKCRSFNFYTQTVDGHDVRAIDEALDKAGGQEMPAAFILNTVKGKGAFFAEGKVMSHNMPVSDADMNEALARLQREGGE